jgi:hypothetical protein
MGRISYICLIVGMLTAWTPFEVKAQEGEVVVNICVHLINFGDLDKLGEFHLKTPDAEILEWNALYGDRRFDWQFWRKYHDHIPRLLKLKSADTSRIKTAEQIKVLPIKRWFLPSREFGPVVSVEAQ